VCGLGVKLDTVSLNAMLLLLSRHWDCSHCREAKGGEREGQKRCGFILANTGREERDGLFGCKAGDRQLAGDRVLLSQHRGHYRERWVSRSNAKDQFTLCKPKRSRLHTWIASWAVELGDHGALALLAFVLQPLQRATGGTHKPGQRSCQLD
jgi:hypothetical protein